MEVKPTTELERLFTHVEQCGVCVQYPYAGVCWHVRDHTLLYGNNPQHHDDTRAVIIAAKTAQALRRGLVLR